MTLMKIAVDARPLSPKPTGIGRYTEEILLHLENEIHCTLYSDKDILTHLKKAELHPSSGTTMPKYFKKSILWQQYLLPKMLKQSSFDLFWSPRHHLPLIGCNKIPMVLTIHDLVYRKHPETMKKTNWLLEKLLLAASVKRADHIITISHAIKQDLISELKTPAEKVTVIHSGYFKPQSEAQIELKTLGIHKPYILFLGTIEPRKNIERLLEAYLTLPQSLQNSYQLVLAGGGGWKNKKLLAKINSLSKDKVNYLGYVNNTEIYTLFKNATCFAFPSIYEGFGLPLLEAMSLGCPALTSQDPACMEISNDAAIHVNAFSIESINQGLEKILSNTKLREELRTKGFKNIKRFSWEKAAQAHVGIFKKVIDQK